MAANKSNKVELSKIFIGEVDGESEAKKEGFEELFIAQDDKYKELIEGDKFLVFGRKGTGKTFLGYYLQNQINKMGRKYCCKVYTGPDLNLCTLLELRDKEISRRDEELIWRYLILNIFADIILEVKKIKKILPGNIYYRLNKVVKKKNQITKGDYNIKEITKTEEVKGKVDAKNNRIGSSVGTEAKKSTNIKYEPKEYYQHIKPIEKLVSKILNKYMNIVIIIDDLDCLKVSEKMDVRYSECIANLLNAVKKINLEIKGKFNSKVIVLVRNDVIDYLHENDTNINKTIASKYIELSWIKKEKKEEPYKQALMNMILLKIKKSTPEYSKLSNKALYEMIFEKEVKNSATAYFLVDHSFGRPRDIIQFLNIVKDQKGDSKRFKSKYFRHHMQDYSNWFYDELRNEVNIHENAAALKDCLKLLKDIKKVVFNIQMVEQHLETYRKDYPNIIDIRKELKSMYKLGVIGNSWPQNNKDGNTTYYVSWSYRPDADSELNFSKDFVIHAALRKKFSLY